MSFDRAAVLETAAKLVERRRYEQAIVEYAKLVEIEPRDARTLLKIGDLQCRLRAYGEAIAAYLRAGDAYVAHGHALKAIAAYTKVRELVASHAPELDERLSSLSFTIAELYRQLGFVSEAVAVLDERARRLEEQGQDAEAIAILRESARMDEQNASVRLRLAEILSRSGDRDVAVAELALVASQLYAAGRMEDALTATERLLQIHPDPSYARLAAEAYLARGTHEDAVRSLSRLQMCIRADPRDIGALELLVQAFTAVGHHDRADEVRREIAAIAEERGLAADLVLAPSAPPSVPAPTSSAPLHAPPCRPDAAPRPSVEERGPIQVIPLSVEAWKAIHEHMRESGADTDHVVAFVCQDGGGRSTMRTMYGVVKMLFD